MTTIPRLLVLLLLLAAPCLPARAQFVLTPGSYELTNGGAGAASLRLVLAENGTPTLLMGVKNGKSRTFRSAEVKTVVIGKQRFIRVDGFRFRFGEDATFTDPVLLESLETGPVELFYYYYLAYLGPNFTAHVKLPVLRKQGTTTFFAYSPGRTPGFDAKLAPGTFVAALFPADPVLQRQFATNSVSRAQLMAAVRAYNQGVRLPR